MLRFSKRSRITFSTPPGGVPIDRDRQPRLWADRPDAPDSHAAIDVDVLDVGDEAVLLDDNESERAASGKFELPPPRLPPRKSAMHTLPPTSLKPQPLPALPAPKAPPKKLATSVAPVAIEVEMPKRPHARVKGPSAGRPNFVWAAALLVVGAAAGFSVSIFAPQGVVMREAAMTAAGARVEGKATTANVAVTDVASPSPAMAVAPTTLTFNDTPLDIHVPAPASAPAIAPAESAPSVASPAQAAPIAVTPKASEKPAANGVVARVAPAPAAKPVALPTKPVEAPARVAAKAPESPASNPAPSNPAPTSHRNLAPAAVDALVSEQLRSALR